MQMNCLMTSSSAERAFSTRKIWKSRSNGLRMCPGARLKTGVNESDPCLQNRGNRLYSKLRSEFLKLRRWSLGLRRWT
jgi:hypothetical protein